MARRRVVDGQREEWHLARAIGVTQEAAWFMLHRICLAMQDETGGKIGGHVEVDDTYIGGRARHMHRTKRDRVIQGGTGAIGKVAVIFTIGSLRWSSCDWLRPSRHRQPQISTQSHSRSYDPFAQIPSAVIAR